FLAEVRRIDPLDLVRRDIGHPEPVVQHQARQFGPVDQHDSLFNSLHVVPGAVGERGRRDEHALTGALPLEAASESLDLGTSDDVLPTLGLDVDEVQTEPVFLDDAVDTTVAALADRSPGVILRSSVSHAHEQINDQLLEERWRSGLDLRQEVVRQRAPELTVARKKLLIRREYFPFLDGFRCPDRLVLAGAGQRLELSKTLEFAEGLVVDSRRVGAQELLAQGGYLEESPLWPFQETCLHQVRACPSDAVLVRRLRAAR